VPFASHREAYDALCCYTLERGDLSFIHQHVVDAFAAQTASETTKPIGVAFALIGLYLHIEKGRSGREVQRAHMALARKKREWPKFPLPFDRGAMTAADVMESAEGPERDRAIDDWCRVVWNAWRDSHAAVAALLESMPAPRGNERP
jgi:hypothetical protein